MVNEGSFSKLVAQKESTFPLTIFLESGTSYPIVMKTIPSNVLRMQCDYYFEICAIRFRLLYASRISLMSFRFYIWLNYKFKVEIVPLEN